ncbi:MAG TPA: bifunctional oligoribonuclease/PAP phosphatase NrnA [Clostridia bacterium]|nr:bifunctional oligoribonuclease/PAP phosphatase NrnA [Clostridia bacterium]HOL60937.1 bifunctional oligoribonuclease/PAP phosphatase NrnA [Clostridia bacterium]HPO53471.1 bifunctional oligoribonuclease/PAP phosphatase NrnA [Clostridia bacterium]
MNSRMYETVIKKLHSAQSIAVFMHISPDADCVSSTLAVYAYLTKAGKSVHCFVEEGNKIRDNLLFLPHVEVINAEQFKTYDLGIAVDCATPGRLGPNNYKKFQKCADHICIDHHISNTPFVEATILEPKAASTTQILYKLFKEFDKNLIDKDIATLLYAGLLTDSGGFSFSATTAETMKIAAELAAYGIDIYTLNRKLIKETKLSVFNLTNRILSRAEFYYDNRVGLIWFRRDDFDQTDTSIEDTEGIVNEIINIDEVKIAIAVSEMDENAYKVGIRTKDGIDASACAAYFGGGGHFNASGCRIHADFQTTIAKLLEMAGNVLNA